MWCSSTKRSRSSARYQHHPAAPPIALWCTSASETWLDGFSIKGFTVASEVGFHLEHLRDFVLSHNAKIQPPTLASFHLSQSGSTCTRPDQQEKIVSFSDTKDQHCAEISQFTCPENPRSVACNDNCDDAHIMPCPISTRKFGAGNRPLESTSTKRYCLIQSEDCSNHESIAR